MTVIRPVRKSEQALIRHNLIYLNSKFIPGVWIMPWRGSLSARLVKGR